MEERNTKKPNDDLLHDGQSTSGSSQSTESGQQSKSSTPVPLPGFSGAFGLGTGLEDQQQQQQQQNASMFMPLNMYGQPKIPGILHLPEDEEPFQETRLTPTIDEEELDGLILNPDEFIASIRKSQLKDENKTKQATGKRKKKTTFLDEEEEKLRKFLEQEQEYLRQQQVEEIYKATYQEICGHLPNEGQDSKPVNKRFLTLHSYPPTSFPSFENNQSIMSYLINKEPILTPKMKEKLAKSKEAMEERLKDMIHHEQDESELLGGDNVLDSVEAKHLAIDSHFDPIADYKARAKAAIARHRARQKMSENGGKLLSNQEANECLESVSDDAIDPKTGKKYGQLKAKLMVDEVHEWWLMHIGS